MDRPRGQPAVLAPRYRHRSCAGEEASTAEPTLLIALQSDPPGAAFARASGYEMAWEVG